MSELGLVSPSVPGFILSVKERKREGSGCYEEKLSLENFKLNADHFCLFLVNLLFLLELKIIR